MKDYEIKITGSGNMHEIKEALIRLINTLYEGIDPEGTYEDPILSTEIKEI